jgi:dienelactone hydrolase
MTAEATAKRDSLADFSKRPLRLLNKTRDVFVAGQGPAVIVLAEIPGVTPEGGRFARWVRDAGFTIYMPVLFGDPGRPASVGYALQTMAKACISGQFHAFRANSSGPITQWLRALARQAHTECGGKGVGAIGMCFTGNFALSMMLEPSMLAPVLSQPSLPLNDPAGLHIAPEELEAVKTRLEREDLTVRAYRFEGDAYCTAQRFAAYQEALGEHFEPRVLPDSAANPEALSKNPHSVVTAHLIDEAGQPTRQAVDDILSFFKSRLL